MYVLVTSQLFGLIKFSFVYDKLNLGCLHPVACVRSGDGGFYPSMQRHYRSISSRINL
jgi:hypothetical protein